MNLTVNMYDRVCVGERVQLKCEFKACASYLVWRKKKCVILMECRFLSCVHLQFIEGSLRFNLSRECGTLLLYICNGTPLLLLLRSSRFMWHLIRKKIALFEKSTVSLLSLSSDFVLLAAFEMGTLKTTAEQAKSIAQHRVLSCMLNITYCTVLYCSILNIDSEATLVLPCDGETLPLWDTRIVERLNSPGV